VCTTMTSIHDREWLFRGNHPQIITLPLTRSGNTFRSHDNLSQRTPHNEHGNSTFNAMTTCDKKLPITWQKETKNFWSFCESLTEMVNFRCPISEKKLLQVSWRLVTKKLKSGGKTLQVPEWQVKKSFQTDDILWQRKSACPRDNFDKDI
jgi:hypothetical protein